jgi:hypothetical protein
MNAQADRTRIEKLKALPPARRAEVADFVDFLAAKERAEAQGFPRRRRPGGPGRRTRFEPRGDRGGAHGIARRATRASRTARLTSARRAESLSAPRPGYQHRRLGELRRARTRSSCCSSMS